MNPGDSVHDASVASRSGLDDARPAGAATGYRSDKPARSPRTQKPLQDIQDIIDKLAVVTQQLRRPGSRPAEPANLAGPSQ
jgi:hypothetical protein